jgi:hypothetical protein
MNEKPTWRIFMTVDLPTIKSREQEKQRIFSLVQILGRELGQYCRIQVEYPVVDLALQNLVVDGRALEKLHSCQGIFIFDISFLFEKPKQLIFKAKDVQNRPVRVVYFGSSDPLHNGLIIKSGHAIVVEPVLFDHEQTWCMESLDAPGLAEIMLRYIRAYEDEGLKDDSQLVRLALDASEQ